MTADRPPEGAYGFRLVRSIQSATRFQVFFRIFLALSGVSEYFEWAVQGSFIGRFWFATEAGVDLGAGPKTGNVSVNHWYFRPGQFPQNEHEKDL